MGAVLAASSMEHCRGSFENRAMVLPLVAATLSLVMASRWWGRCCPTSPIA